MVSQQKTQNPIALEHNSLRPRKQVSNDEAVLDKSHVFPCLQLGFSRYNSADITLNAIFSMSYSDSRKFNLEISMYREKGALNADKP
jgi:hypothetical protein